VVFARIEDGSVLPRAARAEVEAADQLANDQDVHAVEHRRAEIRVRVERRPERQQSLLGSYVCRIELRIAHGPLEHGNRRQASVDGLLRKRAPRCTNRCAAEQLLVELDLGHERLEHEPRLCSDLRADSVPREEDDPFAGRTTSRQGLPR
jgi:hypothetical protein